LASQVVLSDLVEKAKHASFIAKKRSDSMNLDGDDNDDDDDDDDDNDRMAMMDQKNDFLPQIEGLLL
jgi:hypothetical protein